MAVASDAKRRDEEPGKRVDRNRERLIDGHQMRCPRCRVKNDLLRYVPMGMIEEFRHETNPIYKCPECRWVFSPALTIEELKAMFGISSEENS